MPSICVFTHRRREVASGSIDTLLASARAYGIELRAGREEVAKHPELAEAAARAVEIGWPEAAMSADLVLVFGGDGTLLHVLRDLECGPPVMGINHGILGYLAAVEADGLESALERIVAGDVRIVDLPALRTTFERMEVTALNDVVASGGVTGGIIEVAWRIVLSGGGDGHHNEMGVVPCDGMVIATPVGSTAYNLSNGGPVLAWGVDGYVVSFIAPHTLAARPLVVAPGHVVELEHAGRGAPLQLFADGNRVGALASGEPLRVTFGPGRSRLAVFERPSFYARYRDIFAAHTQDFDRNRLDDGVAHGGVRAIGGTP